MKLIELAYTMAYDAKVNYEDVFSQVRMWDNYIYCELLKRKIAIPPKKESATKTEKYAGAYVKEPIPGFYDWVIVLISTLCILTLLCSTISRQRHSKIPDIHQSPLIKYLIKR